MSGTDIAAGIFEGLQVEIDEAKRKLAAKESELALIGRVVPGVLSLCATVQRLEAENERKAEFWRKEYGDMSQEKLIGVAIMRSICREYDMQKIEALMEALKEWFALEPKRPPHIFCEAERKVKEAYTALLKGEHE